MTAATVRVGGRSARVRRFWGARFEATRIIVERAMARGELPASADRRFTTELVGGPIWFRTFVVAVRADDDFVDSVVDAALGALSA